MSDKFFVDTNILLYAHDRSSGPKHIHAKELIERLWESGEGVVSTQVLQEFCVNLRKKVARRLNGKEIRALVEDYFSWEVVVNDQAAIVQALEIEERHKVSYWDALILQAAGEAGASILYSENLADGQEYGPVRVVNPLVNL